MRELKEGGVRAQGLVTLARRRGLHPTLSRNRWICSLALYPRRLRSLRTGKRRIPLLSRVTLILPNRHPHWRPSHRRRRGHCPNNPSDGTAPPCVWLGRRGRFHVEPG
jgi:hypothetical protein